MIKTFIIDQLYTVDGKSAIYKGRYRDELYFRVKETGEELWINFYKGYRRRQIKEDLGRLKN